MNKIILVISMTLLNSSCSLAPIYHGPSGSEPSAILRFQPLEGLTKFEGNTAVYLVEINSQVLPFFRISDKCRLPAGDNEIVFKGISPDMRTKAYARLEFFVKSSEIYTVKREVSIEDMRIYIEDSNGQVVCEKRAEKQVNSTDNDNMPYIPLAK